MDQSKTDLPHHIRNPKDVDNMQKLDMHVIGVMTFGAPEPVQIFLAKADVTNCGSMTVTVIQQSLTRQRQLIDEHNNKVSDPALKRKWPPTLYVQFDNAAKDNKNKTVFNYFACLVWCGIFTKIKINTGIVGHTHDIIDQFFSRLSGSVLLSRSM